MSVVLDYFVLYQIIKKLVSPFSKWDAFKRGIIDDNGNVLKKNLNSQDDKKAWTRFDILIRNLKRIIARIPGGATKIGTFTAALFLLKEYNESPEDVDILTENVYKRYNDFLKEDAPANNIGTGNIALVPARKFKTLKIKRKKNEKRNLSGIKEKE